MARRTHPHKHSSVRKAAKYEPSAIASWTYCSRTKIALAVIASALFATAALAYWKAPENEVVAPAPVTSEAANKSPVRDVSTSSEKELADIPPEAFHPQPPMPAGYNAHSGGLPPGALPPGVVLPGMPTMQGGRTTAQGYGMSDGVRQQFTSKERDNETGLDYFGARYYSSAQGRFTSVDPSRKSINPENPQSWNGYSYSLNNPMAYIDKNGKWPTRIHELIIDQALPGLSKAQLQEIKKGSYSVDDPRNGGQNTAQSNQHGMTIPGQSQENAAEQADQFIETNVDKAKWNYENHGLTSSLWDFGKAFHTVSDMTSPAHEGYQVWNGGIFHPYNTGYHIGEESSISNFRMGLAVGATLALYRYTYGQAELQRATSYTPGSANDPSVKAIQDQYRRPGSNNEAAEGEALYQYRLGLQEGLKFDWNRQRGRKSGRETEPR